MIAGSNAVHYDKEPRRRPEYHAAVRAGMVPGWAADDGAALHFVGSGLSRVVSSRPGASAYRVDRVGRRAGRGPAGGGVPRRAGLARRLVSPKPTIFAMGGGGFTMEPEPSVLDDYVLSLAPAREPRICLLPTAGGDSEEQIRRFSIAFGDRLCEPSHVSLFRLGARPVPLRDHLLAQDVIYVGGGSMINLLALWRAHGLDEILRDAWHAGIVLAGLSAGSMCWFEHGITKSHGHPAAHRGARLPPGLELRALRRRARAPARLPRGRRGGQRCRPATASTTGSGCCSAARASPRSSPRAPARAPTASPPPTGSRTSTSSSRACSRAEPTT